MQYVWSIRSHNYVHVNRRIKTKWLLMFHWTIWVPKFFPFTNFRGHIWKYPLFKRFIVALITDQLLHFYSSVPFLYLNSLSAHSGFPPSLPLISLTVLFGHPSQQLSKKQLWSIFSATASAGDWWQQSGKEMEKARSVKYIKLLSWDQLGYYLELFLCWSLK